MLHAITTLQWPTSIISRVISQTSALPSRITGRYREKQEAGYWGILYIFIFCYLSSASQLLHTAKHEWSCNFLNTPLMTSNTTVTHLGAHYYFIFPCTATIPILMTEPHTKHSIVTLNWRNKRNGKRKKGHGRIYGIHKMYLDQVESVER